MDTGENKGRAKDLRLPVLRAPARASLWYSAASLISKGIGFAVTPIFTRILSSYEYGVYPLYCGWLSVFSVFMTLELGGTVLYGGFAKFKGRCDDFTKSAVLLLVSVFLAVSFIFFLFADRISALSGLPVFLLTVLALHVFADALSSLICTRERYFYSYKRVFFANIAPALLSPVLALILVSRLPSYARSIGAMAASVITAAVLIFKLWKRDASADKGMSAYLLRSSLSLIPAALASVLLTGADKIMIGRYFGSAALAKYSVAHSLGLVLTFATVGLYGALKPWIMRKLAAGDGDSVVGTVKRLLLLFALITAALLALVPELFSFLAPKSYGTALGEVHILALAVLPMFLCNVFSSVYLFCERSWISSACTVFAAVLNIGLNLLFFTRFSYESAAISFLISYSILAALEWLLLREMRPQAKYVLAGALILGFAARILYLLRENLLLRFFILAAIMPSLILSAYKVFCEVREN